MVWTPLDKQKKSSISEGIGKCIIEECSLDKAQWIIDKWSLSADKIVTRRNQNMESLISALNELYRLITSPKHESDRISR